MSNDYPLFCFSGLSNDDFAGWYSAISSSSECNDFCFWKQPDAYYQEEGNVTYETADPHQITQLPNGATWGCLVDAVGEDITWRNALDIYQNYASSPNGTFPHLKCSRGAGQQLKSTAQDLVRSKATWYLILFVTIYILAAQIFLLAWRRRRAIGAMQKEKEEGEEAARNKESTNDKSHNNDEDCNYDDNDGKDGTGIDVDALPTSNETTSRSAKVGCPAFASLFSTSCSGKAIGMMLLKILVVVFDIAIFLVMMISIVTLLEVQHGVDLPFALKIVTPVCADTESLCPAGHNAIEKTSLQITNQSFSYIIASDSQLNWYNGESAYIGEMEYPPPCSSSDSCQSCTEKMGHYTNAQMRISFERLINEEVTLGNDSPPPKTLVVNGDLTQYFHRFEKLKYMSIYHDIRGMEQFFPSLGNHDYDQGSASFDGDEWIGPKYCNSRHAVAYFRSAFCGKIPKFDAKRRLTRYDPHSLAYSWEEANFHFVQVHYHPGFENAALGIKSSLDWIQRDLQAATANNLTSVLFIHAVHGIPRLLEKVLLENKVAAIFAGHLHRCLGQKCDFLRALNTKEAENYFNKTADNRVTTAEKCFPASAFLCGSSANGNALFYLRDLSENVTLPNRKLFSRVPDQSGPCPVGKYATYINTTDNTALCTGRIINGRFPLNANENETTIPVFWSGSASYETFLLASFHSDKIVVNMMTATAGKEGRRYVDTHTVPNAVYPSHEKSDLEEMVIHI